MKECLKRTLRSFAGMLLPPQVCAKAGLEPSAVDYIEAHGTGTVAGDGQELGALEEWYGRTGARCVRAWPLGLPTRPLL